VKCFKLLSLISAVPESSREPIHCSVLPLRGMPPIHFMLDITWVSNVESLQNL